ncbi:MAG TPA: hypothetical protein VIM86_17300 [Thermodesulfobacteriota bacterium]
MNDASDAKRMASAAGLANMDARHLDQLVRSIGESRARASRLPKDLAWTEEVAFTFRPRVRPRTAR